MSPMVFFAASACLWAISYLLFRLAHGARGRFDGRYYYRRMDQCCYAAVLATLAGFAGCAWHNRWAVADAAPIFKEMRA